MTIDPQNPLFRYIDKAIAASAGLVLLWAVANACSSESPARDAFTKINTTIDALESHVRGKIRSDDPGPPTQHYALLSKRYSADAIPSGTLFRESVFYNPDEILGKPETVEYEPRRPLGDRPPVFVMIKSTYAGDFPILETVNYATAKATIVKGKPIANLTMDGGMKALGIVALMKGEATVRVEFPGGTSFTFLLKTLPRPPQLVPHPEQPLAVTATARRGYVTLTWETNPLSCPAASYEISRSDSRDKAGEFIFKLEVNGRETPEKKIDDPDPKPPKAVPQQYEWDDMDVAPGTKYYYTVTTTGIVKDDLENKEVEKTSLPSAQVQVEPLDKMGLILTSGMPRVGMANIEVVMSHGYVVRGHTVRGISRGERVRYGKIDTGYTLIDVEALPRQVTRPKHVIVGGEVGDIQQVPVIQLHNERAILVDANNRPIAIWRQLSEITMIHREIARMLRRHKKEETEALPKIKQNKMEAEDPRLVITNQSDTRLTFIARGKDLLKQDVPPFSTRQIDLLPGDYEMLGVYGGQEGEDDEAFHKDKVKLTKKTGYTIEFKKKKRTPPVLEGKKQDDAAE
jgi:hypothetical protein